MITVTKNNTIPGRLQEIAQEVPGTISIAVPGGAGITFAELIAQSERFVRTLNDLGVGRNDRVGIILRNGPGTVTAFLGVVSCATAAPLNPSYGAPEFEFYLSDLDVRTLLIDSALDSPARDVARKRGIPLVEVSSGWNESIDYVTASGEQAGIFVNSSLVEPDDIALVLHTSGTTSRPKIVPLTHANLVSSADNIIRTLKLTRDDKCLTIMPLFHIHGLMVTLSALLAGGVVCPVGFEPQRFLEIVDDFKPTWYSAVPTMHQAILRAAESHATIIERSRLRFVRSSSAALPSRIKAELEKMFRVPVSEAYGMTEAAHQMASNPLPPGERKSGSVGLAAGPEIAIMDENGSLLSKGQSGEVVIRGANVFGGYQNNENASADAFTDGWFRTGDQGYLDTDGYLFLTGRLKDIINRGGEKISPAEVDEVLLNHPAVEQAITFPIPHSTLGEDIVAAVVLRQNAAVGEDELRGFIAARLTTFKVPQRILIVNDIPKGSTGKIQRRRIPEKLGLVDSGGEKLISRSTYVAPAGTLEHQLVKIWEEYLPVRPISVRDSFFELGGDSLLAVQMMLRVEELVGMQVPLVTLLAGPTVSQLRQAIIANRFNKASSLLVEIHSRGTKPPFFFLHGDIMGGGFYSLNLAHALGLDRPMYVLSPHGLNGEPVPKSVTDMAASYVQMIRTVQPKGPYLLGGYCRGGIVAYETARQIQEQGQDVAALLLIGAAGWTRRYRILRGLTNLVAGLKGFNEDQRVEFFNKGRYLLPFNQALQRYYIHRITEFRKGQFKAQLKWLVSKFRKKFQLKIMCCSNLGKTQSQIDSDKTVHQTRFQILDLAYAKVLEAHNPGKYSGGVVLFWPTEDGIRLTKEWKRVAPQMRICRVPGSHTDCITTYVSDLGACMKASLDQLDFRCD
jgi:oxalate---CoA ligase